MAVVANILFMFFFFWCSFLARYKNTKKIKAKKKKKEKEHGLPPKKHSLRSRA